MFIEFADMLINEIYVTKFIIHDSVSNDGWFIISAFCENQVERSECFKTRKQQKARYQQLCKLLTGEKK